MQQSQEVSVIIPVFDAERYLGAAIESALGQSHAPSEVIVVDDDSTDGSAEVAARFGPPVRYVHQTHGGIGAARNTGARLATGDFLAFLDADDLWTPHKLSLQLDLLRGRPELAMVFGAVRQFRDVDGAPVDPAPEQVVPAYLPGSMLIRRDAFFRAGLFNADWRVGEFIDWFLRAQELGLESGRSPECVLLRRIHDSNQGIRAFDARIDYVRIVRSSLHRRRAREAEGEAG